MGARRSRALTAPKTTLGSRPIRLD
jgi:hypothetical protein